MRVNVRVEQGDRFHVDTFDLYSALSRRRFLEEAASVLGEADAAALSKEIAQVIDTLERERLALRAKGKGEAAQTPMTATERDEALAFLRDPKLTGRLASDFAAVGCVGEESAMLIAYLAALSRKLDEPLSVVFCARSGAGKSTIAALIPRFYDPTAGAVLLDGIDVRTLDPSWLRDRIGIVAQEPILFGTSIAENIRYGRLDASDQEVEAAAKLANAHAFIMATERGYETNVRDRAVRLSGGQAQRIALARAMLAAPDLLILDEATSALDTATERQVQAAIDRVAKGRTVFVIAHRLSTIRRADLILVLEKGRVVERGSHAELLAKGGNYAKYVQLQELGVGVGAKRRRNGINAKRAEAALVVDLAPPRPVEADVELDDADEDRQARAPRVRSRA
jgi:ABC-type multidrug transport system ATPase subunit